MVVWVVVRVVVGVVVNVVVGVGLWDGDGVAKAMNTNTFFAPEAPTTSSVAVAATELPKSDSAV